LSPIGNTSVANRRHPGLVCTFGQIWPTLQRGFSAIAELLVIYVCVCLWCYVKSVSVRILYWYVWRILAKYLL